MPDTFNHFSFRLFPGCCILCGQASARSGDICTPCESDLPHLASSCAICAMPLSAVTSNGARCGNCIRNPPAQDAGRSAFRYAYPLDALVQRFKFNGDHACGRLLGELFSTAARSWRPLPECLLPVPLHPRRLRERGFNQSELLATAITAGLGIEMRADVIRRTRDTAVQSGMKAAARRRNVRGAFEIQPACLPPHVAIVDDVVTTGSTAEEIVRLLRRTGVQRIEVWTLARTV